MPWLIFLVAFAVRLVHIWQIRPSPFFDVLLGDAHGYDEWARRLAAGDWLGTEVFYQAPLYPYFVGAVYAVFDRDLLILRVGQALIGSASCALLGLAGARLFSKPVGLIAGLALALYAPAIFFDGLIQKSVLDMFFVCLSLWLLARILTGASTRVSWIGLGLAMGGLALTRENALVFIAVILAFAVVQKGLRGADRQLAGEAAISPHLGGQAHLSDVQVARAQLQRQPHGPVERGYTQSCWRPTAAAAVEVVSLADDVGVLGQASS